ncbi:MAG: VanW family protein, partial [Actinobacteria bacterium]|nr:VanW family protein [Actinomycetota bacterium]
MSRVAFRIGWVTVAVAAIAVAVVLVRDSMYADRPLPGVEVRAVDLERPLALTVQGRKLSVRAAEALVADPKATEAAAHATGRGTFLSRVRQLLDPSPPLLVVDPVLSPRPHAAALVVRLSAGLDAPRAARIERRGAGFAVVPARPGAVVDEKRLGATLAEAVLDGRRTVVAPLVHVDPALTTDAATEAAATASELVAQPVSLRFAGKRVGSLAPERLARLIHFSKRRNRLLVTFDRERLAKAVQPALDPWRKRAANARFAIEGETVRMTPSRPGLDVNPNVALASVTAAAYSDRRVARLALRETRAELTTREARKLGIRKRISSFTTEMGPSSANRIHNVQLMAEYIHGTLIRPGETFSFNGSVGPRTVERGFREGQMIIGSLLVPSIGGGVCQTATTLFNNAFELGLPILARQNHSFYISHYPMGRDAAVSWGGPDFAFRNDLKTGILIGTSYTSDTLTFSFYGTDPKRRIVASTGPQLNWRTPETTYALDPYAPNGSVRTVSGSNQAGFDVTVSR